MIAKPSIQSNSGCIPVITPTIIEMMDATQRICRVKSSMAPKNIYQMDSNSLGSFLFVPKNDSLKFLFWDIIPFFESV